MLRPKSVAVVGASATPGKIGYTVIKNLLKDGYKGKIYPINQKESEILGLKCYPEIEQVPGEIDSAIMCVPAKVMPEVIEECGKKGVKGALVITSGFSEVGSKRPGRRGSPDRSSLWDASSWSEHCWNAFQLG